MECRLIDLATLDEKKFFYRYVGCIVLTQDKKIMLQQRGDDWLTYPGFLCEFGGLIEEDETPIQALIREMDEELGAKVKEQDVIELATLIEPAMDREELVHAYFWHDKHGTITGCYEGEARYFKSVDEITNKEKTTGCFRWMLRECQRRKLL